MTDKIIFIWVGIVLALAVAGGMIYEIVCRKRKLKSVRAKVKARENELCKQEEDNNGNR